jgi:hypothetical protein
MNRKLTALVIAACLLALVGCSSAAPKTEATAAAPAPAQTDKKDQPAAAAPAAAPAVNAKKPGETVTLGDVKFTVNAVRFAPQIGEKKAKDGYTYFVVEATVENNGKAVFHSNATVQTLAVSADKVSYDKTAVAGLKGQFDGDVAPGAKATGEMAFLVPKTAKGLTFSYTPDLLKQDQKAVYAAGDAQ